MKKRKLRSYVLPTLCLFLLGFMATGVTFLTKSFLEKQVQNDEHYNYTMSVFDEKETPSNNEPSDNSANQETASKPFVSDKVTISKKYYSKEESAENQEQALIFYENTYMPNTGILYESDEVFEIMSVMDGKVKDIKTDEILGTVITIEHNNRVTSVYYGVGETKVNVEDTVTKGQIIATSGTTKLQTTKPQTLLFEVYLDSNLINPEEFYTKSIAELQ